MHKNHGPSLILFLLAVIAVIFAVIGSFGKDIWLASTQWVLVSAVLSIWSVYLKM